MQINKEDHRYFFVNVIKDHITPGTWPNVGDLEFFKQSKNFNQDLRTWNRLLWCITVTEVLEFVVINERTLEHVLIYSTKLAEFNSQMVLARFYIGNKSIQKAKEKNTGEILRNDVYL